MSCGGVAAGGGAADTGRATRVTGRRVRAGGYRGAPLTLEGGVGGGVGSSTTETDGAQDDTDTFVSASFSYAVAPGVKAGAGLHFEENDGYDDDAVGAVMAIQMSF